MCQAVGAYLASVTLALCGGEGLTVPLFRRTELRLHRGQGTRAGAQLVSDGRTPSQMALAPEDVPFATKLCSRGPVAGSALVAPSPFTFPYLSKQNKAKQNKPFINYPPFPGFQILSRVKTSYSLCFCVNVTDVVPSGTKCSHLKYCLQGDFTALTLVTLLGVSNRKPWLLHI